MNDNALDLRAHKSAKVMIFKYLLVMLAIAAVLAFTGLVASDAYKNGQADAVFYTDVIEYVITATPGPTQTPWVITIHVQSTCGVMPTATATATATLLPTSTRQSEQQPTATMLPSATPTLLPTPTATPKIAPSATPCLRANPGNNACAGQSGEEPNDRGGWLDADDTDGDGEQGRGDSKPPKPKKEPK